MYRCVRYTMTSVEIMNIYFQNIVYPVICCLLLACSSLLLPPLQPSSRILIVICCLLLTLLSKPSNLPYPSLLSTLLARSIMLHLGILVETVIVLAIATSVPTVDHLSTFILQLRELICKNEDIEILTQKEIRYQLARLMDWTCLLLFFIVIICILSLFFMAVPTKVAGEN